MAIALGGPPRAPGLQKGRGGFMRSADDAPYVSDPAGDLVKTGERKGEVKRIKYGSPSGVGRLIENDAGLVKYKQRLSFLGIGMDPRLSEACKALVDMEAGSQEFKTCADHIAVEADKITRSWLAADRGSHGHLLCEYVDRGQDFTPHAPAGETLGLDVATQCDVVAAWHKMLADNGLEVLAIEAPCVDDQWRLAGTLDRLVRTTRALRFVMPGGEIVEVPAGIVLVLDIKFGAPRRAHLIQIASYAQSVPYDTDTETRGEWPWPIDQTHALIAHGDFGGDGRPVTIELMWVDVNAGRDHGGRCVVEAKQWSGREDLWSVAQLEVEGVDGARHSAAVDPARHDHIAPSATLVPVEADSGNGSVSELNPLAVPSSTGITDDDFDAPMVPTVAPVAALLPPQPRAESLQWVEASRAAALVRTPTLAVNHDEGATVYLDEAFNALEAEYAGLDPGARAWIKSLTEQALRAGVSFHSHGNRTERRWWIIKGLVSLGIANLAEDEVLRALVAVALDSDAPLFAAITPGHAVGALGAAEAQRFAGLVDQLNHGRLIGAIDDGGVFVLRPVAA